MGWFKSMIIRLLKITPATERRITIKEPLSFQENVLKNQILYIGDSAELEQFFKKTAMFDVEKSRFWASVPHGSVRKMHSGIVGVVVDRFRDIVMSDLDSIEIEDFTNQEAWKAIADSNDINDLIGGAIQGVLASGDGAFKISFSASSEYPVINFYEADSVEYKKENRQLQEILFYTTYLAGNKEYRLEETYGKGYIKYKLYNESGKEVPVNSIEETRDLEEYTGPDQFILALPMMFLPSNKWKGRGKPLFDGKTDVLDALDEVISQWLDAVRMGRVKRYIPSDLLPRDAVTGEIMSPNPFNNDYIATGSGLAEDRTAKINVSQPTIAYEAYVNSYICFMDMVLQGIISPATLGIDLKKTDNAESQREKEKITLHTRNQIVNVLNEIIPKLVNVSLKSYDVMRNKRAGEYKASVKFGEYASPDFDSTVETLSKARPGAVLMSIEKMVSEMYGDTMTDKEKAEEVLKIKAEQGITEVSEPSVNQEGVNINEGKSNESGLSDDKGKIQGAAGSSK